VPAPAQDQLVSEFGVSNPSARKAIRILETEVLVTVQLGDLAATQALVLERFDDSIVTVSSEQARRAIQSSRAGRAG
jgi:DNA-binding FadR family transcriptional regulator